MGNGYFGKLYASAQVAVRFDVPYILPFYIEPELTFNRWDYYRSSNLFFEDVKPAYFVHDEQYAYLTGTAPIHNQDKVSIGGGVATSSYRYYQTDFFSAKDTPDVTYFDFGTFYTSYELNTLNRKQYATQGTYLSFKARYNNGEEYSKPGSTAHDSIKPTRTIHSWVQLKVTLDKYYKQRGFLRLGFFMEAAHCTQPFFNNYTASLLSAPAFQPLAECKTLFQKNFRSHTYLAAGLKNIISIKNKVDLRIEGYVYQPYKEIDPSTNQYAKPFLKRYFTGTASVVGHTPIGPICFSLNYYHNEPKPFSFLFHVGYILFNKKSTDWFLFNDYSFKKYWKKV